MSLVIANGANQISVERVNFDTDSNSFLCFNHENDLVFSYELPFTLADLPDNKFTEKIYLFKNDLLSSRRLLKLRIKETNVADSLVGYIFPMSAFKDNPDIFENVYLQKVAFKVLLKLLKEEDISLKANVPEYRTNADYELSDFYDDDSIVVVVCDQLVAFPNYSFYNYLPTFYKFGFRLSPTFGFFPPPSDCDLVGTMFNTLLKALHVAIPNNKLHLNYFVKSLMTNELFLMDNEVARFHLYYQVIEMLMEKVFKNELSNQIIRNFTYLDGHDIKELFRDMQKGSFSLEKLIGDNYSKIISDIREELAIHIDDFLKYIGIVSNSEKLHSRLYKVRNTLFHSYSKVLDNQNLDKAKIRHLLKKVNDSFEYLLFDLITSYKNHDGITTAPMVVHV